MVKSKQSNQQFIDVELSPSLKEANIVTRYRFDLDTLDIILELNHEYVANKIVSPIELSDWDYTIESFVEKMQDLDVSEEHISMICDSANDNAHKLTGVKTEGRDGGKNKDKDVRRFTAYKYSFNFEGDLHEAVILDGKRCFIKYDNTSRKNPIKIVNEIREESRVITPPHKEEYAYRPYEFKDKVEILQYLERAKKLDIGKIYWQLKKTVCGYNDQSPEEQILLTSDVIWSYFQDKFPTTRYSITLGGNGSGKSSEAKTYAVTAYRPVSLTNPNAANINRILGCIEPGQCTIISDETRGLEKNTDLLSILAEGYQIDGQVSKVNDISRRPEFYKAYCYKKILAEKVPNLKELKGIIDRSFQVTSYKGHPMYDIKETTKHGGNPHRKLRFELLMDFRKLMFIYRLYHFKDQISDIDVGVQGREKELVKPTIQLFFGSSAQKEIEGALQHFLDKRREKKDVGIEPILHSVVTALCNSLERSELTAQEIWEKFKEKVPGYSDVEKDKDGNVLKLKRPNEYHSQDYGTIYLTSLSNILEHTFGGTPKHRWTGNAYIFNRSQLAKVSSSLTRDVERIHTTYKPEEAEDPEAKIIGPIFCPNDGEPDGPDSDSYLLKNIKNINTNMWNHGCSASSDGEHSKMASASSGSSGFETDTVNDEPDLDYVKAKLAQRYAGGE